VSKPTRDTPTSPPPPGAAPSAQAWLPPAFAGLFGAFLGLTLLKFGNPPIMERYVVAPTEIYEFLVGTPWPIGWAYRLLALVSVLGLCVARWKPAAPLWFLALPALWLAWQVVAVTQSVDPQLSDPTLSHLAAGTVCFYLGFFGLSRVERSWPFWLGLAGGFLVVLAVGFEQHFGGLEASRRYFFLYLYPMMKEFPPEYLKKITSSRIFSTTFYPNALAGVLLLLLPAVLAGLWRLRDLLTTGARLFLVVVVGAGGLACLYWSGSKGGWLLMLLLGLLALLRGPFPRRLKIALVACCLLAGLAGFTVKYFGFFRKGAPSVSARFDYWQAAARTARDHPLFGTGPGTFAVPYQKLKRPESEMARLVHNDYLEQASDSGLVGFGAYGLFIVAGLVYGFPRTRRRQPAAGAPADGLPYAVWLGLLGWGLQGFFEFSLYLPGLAWPALALLGWLVGRNRRPLAEGLDKPARSN
jgi:O-antigen ligase